MAHPRHARLVALIPLAAALALGAVRVVAATYDELVVPSDTATPIVVRVVRAAPEVILVAVAAWILGEILGAVAARRIALDDDQVGGALRAAVRVGQHPLAALAGSCCRRLPWRSSSSRRRSPRARPGRRSAGHSEAGDPLTVVVTVVLFVGLWVAGLFLVAIVSAWRAAVWTVART